MNMESEIHDYDHDDDDLEQDDDQLELKQGMTFDTWKIAEAYLETFAKYIVFLRARLFYYY